MPAAAGIFEYISDPDTVIKLAATLLCQIWDMILRRFAETSRKWYVIQKQLIIDYLKFIEQLKDKSMAAQYCRNKYDSRITFRA
jgi:hypothetical protein